jgi:hypothetical protein
MLSENVAATREIFCRIFFMTVPKHFDQTRLREAGGGGVIVLQTLKNPVLLDIVEVPRCFCVH